MSSHPETVGSETVGSETVGSETVGSGLVPVANPNRPVFPQNHHLVLEECYASTLHALLPVLQSYKCLEENPKSIRSRPGRSRWVRAFCDLYHDAGPWGKNSFRKTPDITSKRKYTFKSYQIPKIFEALKRYKGNNPGHLALRQALEEYYERIDYWHGYMEASEAVCEDEAKKPADQRAPFPAVHIHEDGKTDMETVVPIQDPVSRIESTGEDDVNVESGGDDAENPSTRTSTLAAPSTADASTGIPLDSTDVIAQNTDTFDRDQGTLHQAVASRADKFSALPATDKFPSTKDATSAPLEASTPPSRTLPRIKEEDTDPEPTSLLPRSAVATPSPTAQRLDTHNSNEANSHKESEHLLKKRLQLEDHLKRRRDVLQSSNLGDDVILKKIHGKIDDIDMKLLELIDDM